MQDKNKIKNSKKDDSVKEELIYIADMLANVIMSEDRDAIIYAFVAYKFMAKSHKLLFLGRVNKVFKLLKGVLNGI